MSDTVEIIDKKPGLTGKVMRGLLEIHAFIVEGAPIPRSRSDWNHALNWIKKMQEYREANSK